jgi:hypothetical protein
MPRIIKIQPYKNGWCCFERKGVEPYWTGKNAKEEGIDYAKQRIDSEGSLIRILNEAGELEETLQFKDGEFQSVA